MILEWLEDGSWGHTLLQAAPVDYGTQEAELPVICSAAGHRTQDNGEVNWVCHVPPPPLCWSISDIYQ